MTTSGYAYFMAYLSFYETKSIGLWGNYCKSGTDTGNNRPVGNVSAKYFLRSISKRAYYSYFFLFYYYNLFASSSASFLFLGGISQTLIFN